jgi:hypothetical protein
MSNEIMMNNCASFAGTIIREEALAHEKGRSAFVELDQQK